MHEAKCDKYFIAKYLLKSNMARVWLHVLIMSRTHFRVNLHSIVAWLSKIRTDTGLKAKITQPFSQTGLTLLHRACLIQCSTPPRWNSPWRGEGAYLTKRFSPSASTSRARRSNATRINRSAYVYAKDLIQSWRI